MLTEAIILAGGKGTRLLSEVSSVPKPMARIGDKPFLEILIETFHKKGINRFILATGYMSEVIQNHFKNRYTSIDIVFSKEAMPLGTGGALRLAMTHVNNNRALVLNGDTLFDVDLKDAYPFLVDNHSAVIFGRYTEDIARYGEFIHKDGHIQSYQEKENKGKGYINGGIYVINKDALNKYPLNKKFSFEEKFLASIKSDDNFILVTSNGYFIDIGIPDDYRRAQCELMDYISDDYG